MKVRVKGFWSWNDRWLKPNTVVEMTEAEFKLFSSQMPNGFEAVEEKPAKKKDEDA